MKSMGLALIGAALACVGTAAQATVYDFDVIYWEDTQNSPPTDPDASQTAHFQIDDAMGNPTSPQSHYQSLTYYGVTGQFFGYTGPSMVWLFPDSAYGGLSFAPWPADSDGPLYTEGRDLWGDSVVNEALSKISTGTFLMGDWGDRSGLYQVTVSEVVAAGVPEPASWALMLGGFAAVGGALRSRRKAVVHFG